MLLGTWLIGQSAGAAPEGPGRKEAAAAVEAAAQAFAAGDWARALGHFERAMALRPAAKLHYNIGVCRQQLMQAARERGDAAEEAGQAAAAVASFNAYLREVPAAEDRAEVEEMVRGLGGTPLTQPRLKPIPPPRVEPAETAEPAATAEQDKLPEPDKPPEPGPVEVPGGGVVPGAPEPPRTEFRPQGRVGASLGLLAEPQVGLARLDGAVQGLVIGRIGGFTGARGRVYLGASLMVSAAGNSGTGKPALTMQTLSFDAEYNHPLGQGRRVELVLGGFASGAREGLRTREGQALPTCAARSTGTLASQRGGGGAGGRVGLLVLLGARRNHEISVRISTAILGFGAGTATSGCAPRPFAEVDVPRARLVIVSDAGYAFRF